MKLLLSLLLTFISFVISNAQNQFAYSIWNNGTMANFGIINLDNSDYNSTFEINNYQFINGETSTFNAKTNEITTIGYSLLSSSYYFLYTYETENWVKTGYMPFPSVNYLISSIESDQTTGQFNFFATMIISGLENQNPAGTFSVTKLAPSTNNYKVIDVLKGTFSTSTYNWATAGFVVTFTNATGIFINQYSQVGQLVSSFKYIYSGFPIGYTAYSAPYCAQYIPQRQAAYNLLTIKRDSITLPDVFWPYSKYNQMIDLGYFSSNIAKATTTEIFSFTGHITQPILYFFTQTTQTDQYPNGLIINKITTKGISALSQTTNVFYFPIVNVWAF